MKYSVPAEKSLKVSETETRELLEGTADIPDSQKGSLISAPGQSVILSLFEPLIFYCLRPHLACCNTLGLCLCTYAIFQNIVILLPQFFWESQRWVSQCLNIIKEIGKQKRLVNHPRLY